MQIVPDRPNRKWDHLANISKKGSRGESLIPRALTRSNYLVICFVKTFFQMSFNRPQKRTCRGCECRTYLIQNLIIIIFSVGVHISVLMLLPYVKAEYVFRLPGYVFWNAGVRISRGLPWTVKCSFRVIKCLSTVSSNLSYFQFFLPKFLFYLLLLVEGLKTYSKP